MHHRMPQPGPDTKGSDAPRRRLCRVLLIAGSCCLLALLGMGGAGWWIAGRMGLMHGPMTAAIGFGENWSTRAIAQSQAQGDAIVAAIEKYRADHGGEFPPSLDALVPESITAIGTPTVGDRHWKLGILRNHPGKYSLSVRSRWMNHGDYFGIEWMQYNSLDRRWRTFRDESLLLD